MPPSPISSISPLVPPGSGMGPSMGFALLDRITPQDRDQFGHKSVSLALLQQRGLPVPTAVAIPASQIEHLLDGGITLHQFRASLREMVAAIERGEKGRTKRRLRFGHDLLLSVRSAPREYRAGVHPTLLRVGFTRASVSGVSDRFEDPIGTRQAFLRYLIDYATLVGGIPRKLLEPYEDPAGTRKALRGQIKGVMDLYGKKTNSRFPNDPWIQLEEAVMAIGRSSRSPQIRAYRSRHGIPEDEPCSVMIQAHVFGDLGRDSLSGIVSTRDYRTGEGIVTGRIKFGSAGDFVMSGGGPRARPVSDLSLLAAPLATEVKTSAHAANDVFGGPQKLEITVQTGDLAILQSSDALLWPFARLRAAVEDHKEGRIDLRELRKRVGEPVLNALQLPTFERPKGNLLDRALFMGGTLSPGIATGPICVYRRPSDKPDSPSVLLVPGHPPVEEWEDLLERAAALVFLEEPGHHLIERAFHRGIPVVAPVRARVDVLERGGFRVFDDRRQEAAERGDVVSVDASHPEAVVLRGSLNPVLGTVARGVQTFLKGGPEALRVAEVKGRRSRERLGVIRTYFQLMEKLGHEELLEEVDQIAARLLDGPELGLTDVEDAIFGKKDPAQWGRKSWDGLVGQSTYAFGPLTTELVVRLYRDPGKRLITAFLKTYFMQHNLAVSLFNALPLPLRGPFLNEYVQTARETGYTPGARSGAYLLARMVSSLTEKRDWGEFILGHLEPDTLRFLVEELSIFYGKLDHPHDNSELREMHGIRERFPGLVQSEMRGLLRRGLSSETVERILADEGIVQETRDWFRDFLKGPAT